MTAKPNTFHDFSNSPPPTGYTPDPVALAKTLPARFAALGVADALVRSTALLERSEALTERARERKNQAQAEYGEAIQSLADGAVDLDEYTAALVRVAPWLDFSPNGEAQISAAWAGLMQVAAQLRGNAVASMTNESSTLYARLQPIAAEAVQVIASGPKIPNGVFNAADPDKAAVAQGADFGHWWITAQAAAARFEEAHRLARVLRDNVGGLGALTVWPGACPSWCGVVYRKWEKALADDALRQLQTTKSMTCRIRLGVDNGWEPGLWLAPDLVDQPAPKPSLLQRITGGQPA
jgi:hypothetical protein